MGSAGFYIAAICIFALGIAAGAGFFLYQRKGNGDTRLFTPRSRRLAYVERAPLDGGRKLLLIRRDNVEHLILVGGPIDLVVETGIRSERIASAVPKEQMSSKLEPLPEAPSAWPLVVESPLTEEPVAPAEPRLPLSPQVKEEKQEEEKLAPVLAAVPQAKAAE